VKDNVLVDEQEIALDLLIECIRQFYAACGARSWFHPFPTDTTRVYNFGYYFQHPLAHTYSFEKSSHCAFLGVPPPYVQFPQREADGTFTVSAKHTNNPTDIEITPVIWLFGVVALILISSSHPWFRIWSSSSSFRLFIPSLGRSASAGVNRGRGGRRGRTLSSISCCSFLFSFSA